MYAYDQWQEISTDIHGNNTVIKYTDKVKYQLKSTNKYARIWAKF